MRFKKGTRVEIMEKEVSPVSSWRPARIIEGNGRTYVVKYDNYDRDKSLAVEKVPRKLLRPCPPTIWQRGFAPGDIIEVFESNTWQLAEFSRSLGSNTVVVRLIGSSKEIQAHRFQLRIPCTWKDNAWIMFSKESVERENAPMNIQSKGGNLTNQFSQSCLVAKTGDDMFSAEHGDCANQQYRCSERMKKRNNACLAPIVSASCKKKRIKTNENSKRLKLTITHLPTQLLEKVDAVDSKKNICGGKCMHAALKKRRAELIPNEVVVEKRLVGSSHDMAERLDVSDDESAASSVGSCSVSNGSYGLIHYKASQNRHVHENYGDSESFTTNPKRTCLYNKERMLSKKCKVDLDAYHSTMRLFFESGCLSWEQESLLTNLRLSLRISNDEHLMVLKNLMHARR